MRGGPPERDRRGIPLRSVIPNAITAFALCSGLTGIRFAISGDWDRALMFIGFALAEALALFGFVLFFIVK